MMHAYVYAMQMQCNYGAKHLKCYSANLDVRLVHGFCKTYHRLQIILDTPDRTPR
jgi:hypothetical protein